VVELLGYLDDPRVDAAVRAIPGQGTHVPVWILGSSLFGAQLAAHLGLPYAFASHFAPAAVDEAAAAYRELFRPSARLERPRFMLALNAFAAETDSEGVRLKTSMQQAFANLRLGRPGRLPRPVDDIRAVLDPGLLAGVEQALAFSAVGARDGAAADRGSEVPLHEKRVDRAAVIRAEGDAADVPPAARDKAPGPPTWR
jgi:luciferase family oxidoreductase group 1